MNFSGKRFVCHHPCILLFRFQPQSPVDGKTFDVTVADPFITYSPSYNLTPPISRVLIGQHLIFYSLA